MAESAAHRVEDEAKIKVECISHVFLVVDSDREAENLEIIQRDANETSLQLNFRNNII